MDKVEEIDITIDMNDSIETIHGVGGSEFVYKKTIDGIIGIDFLRQIGAIIDLEKMKVYSRSDNEK
ncbi:UNVERIFIED_ORG: hypothetical protein B2H98_02515 [Clostridium botulinum]